MCGYPVGSQGWGWVPELWQEELVSVFYPIPIVVPSFSKIMTAPNLSYSPTTIACTPTHVEMPGSCLVPE